MWVNTLERPGRFVHREMAAPVGADLTEGQVIARFLGGAICGSDLPMFRGRYEIAGNGPHDGFPLHEVVGEVVETRSALLARGDRVAGKVPSARGMSEYFIGSDTDMIAVESAMSDRDLVVVQSLATVLSACARAGTVDGRHVAVIGQGPLGLLWSHVLKSAGAARVTGVDQVDRSDVADAFSVDEVVWANSADWAASLGGQDRPALVVEAVGHQVGTLNDAVMAVAPGGLVVGFGVPDDAYYPLAFVELFRKNASLVGCVTTEWPHFLRLALAYLEQHPGLADSYITHEFSVADVQKAYDCAVIPAAGRLKVALLPQGGGR